MIIIRCDTLFLESDFLQFISEAYDKHRSAFVNNSLVGLCIGKNTKNIQIGYVV